MVCWYAIKASTIVRFRQKIHLVANVRFVSVPLPHSDGCQAVELGIRRRRFVRRVQSSRMSVRLACSISNMVWLLTNIIIIWMFRSACTSSWSCTRYQRGHSKDWIKPRLLHSKCWSSVVPNRWNCGRWSIGSHSWCGHQWNAAKVGQKSAILQQKLASYLLVLR